DLGLTPTVSRELARYAADQGRGADARDFVRTLEAISWGIALVIGAASLAAAPLIAHYWVRNVTVSRGTVQGALALLGAGFALQWPSGFYLGGLLGRHRLVLMNVLRAGAALVRFGGAAIVVRWVSPTLMAFILWQIVASAVQTAASRHAIWHGLPAGDVRPRFRWALVGRVWRFAAGVSAIAIVTLVITQLDKVVLSRL